MFIVKGPLTRLIFIVAHMGDPTIIEGIVRSIWVILKLGPLLVLGYIAAPNIYGYQSGTLFLGTAHLWKRHVRRHQL